MSFLSRIVCFAICLSRSKLIRKIMVRHNRGLRHTKKESEAHWDFVPYCSFSAIKTDVFSTATGRVLSSQIWFQFPLTHLLSYAKQVIGCSSFAKKKLRKESVQHAYPSHNAYTDSNNFDFSLQTKIPKTRTNHVHWLVRNISFYFCRLLIQSLFWQRLLGHI